MHNAHKCTRFGLISLNSDWPSNELESNPHCTYLPALLCATCSSWKTLNKCDNKLHSSEHLQILLSLNSCRHRSTCTPLFLSPHVGRLVPVSTRTHMHHGLESRNKHVVILYFVGIPELYTSHVPAIFRLTVFSGCFKSILSLLWAPTRLRRAPQGIHLQPQFLVFHRQFRRGCTIDIPIMGIPTTPQRYPHQEEGFDKGLSTIEHHFVLWMIWHIQIPIELSYYLYVVLQMERIPQHLGIKPCK